MKLIIQIPCYNEAETLPLTLDDLPRQIEGIDQIEILVIDDGSSDDTVEVARSRNVHHVVRLTPHRGLAAAFNAGLRAGLQRGADVIVNMDGDHAFRAEDIARLIAPILAGRAGMVIGVRPLDDRRYFPPLKKALHRLGSWLISRLIGQAIPDPTSGFRAYSRDAAMKLHIVSRHTYVLESIIQAAHQGVAFAHVPIGVNPPLRPSRLIKSTAHYVAQSAWTVLRACVSYRMGRLLKVVAPRSGHA
ncbi:MAG: glycosyltransferase family 2 protein [Acidobacteriota bacterium]|nr:glycosyltransferase family 2 protein [Blastocatellia bacterium]MDW8241113.1 glycosyltransferase family 2 protein [Acidobacteriota bacterium]